MKKRMIAAMLAGMMSISMFLGGCQQEGAVPEGNQAQEAGEGEADKAGEPEAGAENKEAEKDSQEAEVQKEQADTADASGEDKGDDKSGGMKEEDLSVSGAFYLDSWYDTITSETEGSDELDYRVYGDINIERLVLVDDKEHEALSKAMNKDFEERKKATQWFRDSVRESLSYEGVDYSTMSYPWPYNDKLSLYRADDKIVSYLSRAEQYTGGAHGGTSLTGCTFDTESGKKLALRDVISDFDAFYDKVIEKLEVNKDYYWDEWKETVHRDVYDDDSENGAFAWMMGKDYVELIFGDYELGAYATGHVKVKVSEEDMPGLLNGSYKDTSAVMSVELADWENYRIDLDGDGEEDFVRVVVEDEYDEEYNYVYSSSVKVYVGRTSELKGDGTEGRASEAVEDNSFMDAWLMRSEGGKYYVMVTLLSDNDWKEVYTFDVNDPDKEPELLGVCEAGAFYNFPPMDPNHLVVENRINTMGTRSGYRICHLTDEGKIEPYDPEFRVIYFDFLYEDGDEDNEWRYLKAKTDVEAYTDRDKSGSVTIPRGTKLIPLRTDDEDYLVCTMPDGSEVCIYYDEERSEDSWERNIGGKSESEVFDGIMYAG